MVSTKVSTKVNTKIFMAVRTQEHQKLREQVTCTMICLQPYSEPKALQCSHVFCQQCLQGLVRKRTITCPLCQQDTNLLASEGGAEELKSAFHLNNLLEFERTLSKGSEMDKEHNATTSARACNVRNMPEANLPAVHY